MYNKYYYNAANITFLFIESLLHHVYDFAYLTINPKLSKHQHNVKTKAFIRNIISCFKNTTKELQKRKTYTRETSLLQVDSEWTKYTHVRQACSTLLGWLHRMCNQQNSFVHTSSLPSDSISISKTCWGKAPTFGNLLNIYDHSYFHIIHKRILQINDFYNHVKRATKIVIFQRNK